MFKEELMNKLVGYLEQIMFEKKKKKKKKKTYWRKVCMGYWVVTAEQTQKVHQEKKNRSDHNII